MPKFEENAPADLVEAFGKTLTGMGGRLVTDSTNDTRAVADPQSVACKFAKRSDAFPRSPPSER